MPAFVDQDPSKKENAMMSDYASILLQLMLTTYVSDCVESARAYIRDYNEDMQMDPSLDYDTLYKGYLKLSDEEIEAITAAIIKDFFLEIGIGVASNQQLKDFMKTTGSTSKKGSNNNG